MIVYTGAQFLFYELCRRFVWFATIIVGLMPLSIPFWGNQLTGWFRWAKSLSVIIPTSLVNLSRLAHLHPHPKWQTLTKKWPMWTLYVVIVINILQASIKDFSLGNYFNGIAGIILIATIPITPENWNIDPENKNDFCFGLSKPWCFLYTTWNIAFVYAENPSYVAHVTCILFVPLWYAIIQDKPHLWYQARAYTLALSLFIRSAYDFVTPMMDSAQWFDPAILSMWGGANAVLCLAYGFKFLKENTDFYIQNISFSYHTLL